MEYPLTYADYQEGLKRGKFIGARCSECDGVNFPPRAVCSICGGKRLEPVDVEGKGRLRSFTVARVAPRGFKPPYIVGLVELEQGPWVIGNIIDLDPEAITMEFIGNPVQMGSMATLDSEAEGEARVLTFRMLEQ